MPKYEVHMIFYKPPTMTIQVEAPTEKLAIIRSHLEAVRAGNYRPRKTIAKEI